MSTLSNKKNYLLTLFSGLGGVVFANIVGFISVPIALNYWKVERYGLWALITSMLVYLSVSNLGLNFSATTLMTKNPNIANKFKILKRTLKILSLSLLVGCAIFVAVNLVDKNWINVLGKIPDYMRTETYYAVFVLGVFFFINTPFSLLSSLFSAFQKAYIDNVFALVVNLINFATLLTVIWLKGNLMTYALINGVGNLILNIAKLMIFYHWIYKKIPKEDLVEQNDNDEETSAKSIFITGLRFFLIGLAAMVVWNTDNIVISNLLSIKQITPYSITLKPFFILFNIIFTINLSLLPILGKEIGNKNWEWINRTYQKFIVIMAVLGGGMWLGGILFSRDFITLWTNKDSYAGLLTVCAFGGYAYLLSMINLNSNIVNTFNYLENVAFVGWMEALVKIASSIILLHYFGIAGVALGTFVGALLVPTWVLPKILSTRSGHKLHYNLDFVLKNIGLTLIPLLIGSIAVQLLIHQMIMRITAGLSIMIIYAVLNYLIIPDDVKEFVKKNGLIVVRRLFPGTQKVSPIQNP